MNKLANQVKHKSYLYARRKHRTNTVAKQFVSPQTPRLVVQRTNKYIYVQLIAQDGVVLTQANDVQAKTGNKSESAYNVGEVIGKAALALGYSSVVFDRNGFLYHGRVKQLAEGARSAGLKF